MRDNASHRAPRDLSQIEPGDAGEGAPTAANRSARLHGRVAKATLRKGGARASARAPWSAPCERGRPEGRTPERRGFGRVAKETSRRARTGFGPRNRRLQRWRGRLDDSAPERAVSAASRRGAPEGRRTSFGSRTLACTLGHGRPDGGRPAASRLRPRDEGDASRRAAHGLRPEHPGRRADEGLRGQRTRAARLRPCHGGERPRARKDFGPCTHNPESATARRSRPGRAGRTTQCLRARGTADGSPDAWRQGS
jgi:hypothetical protein